MTRYVIDASAAVEYLLRTRVGRSVASDIEHAFLLAPELLDVEVLSALRRAVLHKRLAASVAQTALDDLVGWQVTRIPHRALAPSAWKHLHNASAYDAFYVAAARIFDAPLLTADGPLSRAAGLGIVVQNVRVA